MPARFDPIRGRLPALALAGAVLAGVFAGGCGKENQVSPVPDCSGFRLLAFASDRNQAAGQTDIYLFDLDLGGFHALPSLNTPAPQRDPAISSDRRSIAYVETSGGDDDILFYDRCLGLNIPLAEMASPVDESEPAFSGDGGRIAFVRDTTGGGRVRLFDGQTVRLIPLPALDSLAALLGPYDDRHPSPDQSALRIAFASNRDGNWDVWVYDRGGDSLLDVPDLRSPGNDVEPVLTPNGRYLAFASDRAGGSGGYDLYLYDLQARTFVPMPNLNSPQDDRDPAISRDALYLVFTSTRAGGQGRIDLWNYTRPATSVGQLPEESSAGDDFEPGLAWP